MSEEEILEEQMDTTSHCDTDGDEQMETHNAGKYSDRRYTEWKGKRNINP